MSAYVDGKEIKEKLLEDLNNAIRTNSDITNKQNELLLKYNKWLIGLTIAVCILTLMQLIISFGNSGDSAPRS